MKKNWTTALLMTIVSLLLICAPALGESEETEGIAPFFFDGCSIVPEGTNEDPNLWCECCLEHDRKYWKGGTWLEKLEADLELRDCVAEKSGSEALGMIYYTGVRVGGSAFYDSEFRWGFGWPFGRGYQALTPAEEADAEIKFQEWLAENPDICLDFN